MTRRLRKALGWSALSVGMAVLVILLLVSQWISLRDGVPVRIGFEPGERHVVGEAALFLHRADYALQGCCPGSTFLARGIAGDTGLARGFRVRPTDARVKGNFRSELRLRPNPVGSTVWYRARVFVPASWPIGKVGVIAMQWHGSKDFFLLEPGKYPPLDLAIVGDRWVLTKSWDTRIRTTHTPIGNVEGKAEIGDAPLQRGRWLEWRFRVHWSIGGAGSVQAWLDGRRIADDHGPNAHRDLIGPYLKAGVYVPDWGYHGTEPAVVERVLLFDDIEVAYGADPFGIAASR